MNLTPMPVVTPEHDREVTALIEELSQYAAIFASSSRDSVDISSVKYEVFMLGKKLMKIGGRSLIDWAFQQVNDATNEIEGEWRKLRFATERYQ